MARLTVVTSSLLCAIFILTSVGCGPRGEVIAESIVDEIDKAIGEFKVRRKEIEINIDKLENSITKLREGATKSKVQSTQLERKIDAIDDELEKYKEALGKLKKEMESDSEAILLGGKEYTKDQVEDMAAKVIASHKTATTKRDGLAKAKDILSTNASKLEGKVDTAKQQVSSMKAQLEEIDAKLIAVNNIRDASQIAGSDSETLAENFDEVQGQIDNLFVKVETATLIEFDGAEDNSSDMAAILESTGAGGATIDDIDAILGGE